MALLGEIGFKGSHEMKLKSIGDCTLCCESLGIHMYYVVFL